MDEHIRQMIRQGREDIQRWVDEANTPEGRAYRVSIAVQALDPRKRIQWTWKHIEQSPRVQMPAELQLPDWARRLEEKL